MSKKTLTIAIVAAIAAVSGTTAAVRALGRDNSAANEEHITALAEPNLELDYPLVHAIDQRRSVRSFSDRAIEPEKLSMLLWSAQGITAEPNYRAAPSAGATYPMELFVLDSSGIRQYRPDSHSLVTISERDRRAQLARASLGQQSIAQAPVSIVITADYERTTERYGQRGIRFVHMEAGHIGQNIQLQAVALGLGSVPVGAFEDSRVAQILSLEQNLEPLYIFPIGYAGH